MATPVAGPGGLISVQTSSSQRETRRWGVSPRIQRRLTRRLRVGVRYSYNKQQSKSATAASFNDFDDHIVTVGISYDFDRYSLDRVLGF